MILGCGSWECRVLVFHVATFASLEYLSCLRQFSTIFRFISVSLTKCTFKFLIRFRPFSLIVVVTGIVAIGCSSPGVKFVSSKTRISTFPAWWPPLGRWFDELCARKAVDVSFFYSDSYDAMTLSSATSLRERLSIVLSFTGTTDYADRTILKVGGRAARILFRICLSGTGSFISLSWLAIDRIPLMLDVTFFFRIILIVVKLLPPLVNCVVCSSGMLRG